MPAHRILIVCHPLDTFWQKNYTMRLLAENWRQRSDISVQVVNGPASSVVKQLGRERLIVISHLDLTFRPDVFKPFFDRCPVVLNRAVSNISKRFVSRNIVNSPYEFDGPVIVKTNRNAGGAAEKTKVRRGETLGRKTLSLLERLPWHVSGLLGPQSYRVYEHPKQVPWTVWRHPWLVVEKFFPEMRDGEYCLRQYTFFGSQEANVLACSKQPVVKSWNVTRREILSESPPELREFRAKLGFDYGKFDYVIHNGKPIVFDVNPTPTFRPNSAIGSPAARLAKIASGIETYLQ